MRTNRAATNPSETIPPSAPLSGLTWGTLKAALAQVVREELAARVQPKAHQPLARWCEAHGVALGTARAWIADGRLRPIKVGKRLLVSAEETARIFGG